VNLHPLHPATSVTDGLADSGWRIIELLAFTRSSTLILASQDDNEPVVIKAGFGSNHVLAEMDEQDRPAAYGFYWYQQMTPAERVLSREDFRHERELARDCRGATRVVSLIDEGECGGFDWYTMPHYPDGNLRAFTTQNASPAGLGASMTILADVAAGLDELHRRGIVHRDLYQENVLLKNGRGVITDLGAACRIGEARGPRRRGPEVHWPPEYAHSYAEATPGADVYSLAVLAYRILFADLPRLDGPRHLDGLPTTVTDHITAALANNPDARPTMTELHTSFLEGATATP
jgi:serine/threonine-protein kinase